MFEIYAYGNVDTLNGIFNAIASIMGGADYFVRALKGSAMPT